MTKTKRSGTWMTSSLRPTVPSRIPSLAWGGLGLGERQVAIPVSRFKGGEGRIVLPGATKDAL
jgi:hypothetical protein